MPCTDQLITENYAIYNADSMEVLPELATASADISVYSPPFPELYQYSDDPRDMCNCVSYEESLEQYRFIVSELARITKPGRINCVHCTDLKRPGGIRQRDYPGDIIRIYEDNNFHFFCRVTIWKDPWEFARRTRMKSLMHKTVSIVDSTTSRIAPADFLLIFKRVGENAVPVLHEKGFRHYAGETELPADLVRDYGNFKGSPRENLLSHWIWRQYASPVWMDIRRGRLMPYNEAKEDPEEKHVCPLQLDVIERCITLYSNPGETLITPFMGVGSEVYTALVNDRKGVGIELKPTYYRQAAKNLAAVNERESQFTLV